jgi:hypothetical protein
MLLDAMARIAQHYAKSHTSERKSSLSFSKRGGKTELVYSLSDRGNVAGLGLLPISARRDIRSERIGPLEIYFAFWSC